MCFLNAKDGNAMYSRPLRRLPPKHQVRRPRAKGVCATVDAQARAAVVVVAARAAMSTGSSTPDIGGA
ncbi:MAG: hypothetical protein JWP17_2821 [Solirubrobacterales bacterium]|jgi:hypothetical protein|nr:hypothetical protein [Solirubrobacterales bacterium]